MNSIWIKSVSDWKKYIQIKESMVENKNIVVNGLAGSQMAYFLSTIVSPLSNSYLLITYNELQASRLYNDINCFFPKSVFKFPSRETLFYNAIAKSTEIIEQRLRVLSALAAGEKIIVICSIDAILYTQTPKNVFENEITKLKVGDILQLDVFSRELIRLGYERVFTIEGKGQFSIRGGILDIFPLVYDNPYRVEFFDDEIDSIREFDIQTQCSINKKNSIRVFPARELIINDEIIDSSKSRIISDKNTLIDKISNKNYDKINDKVDTLIDNLTNRTYIDMMDNFFSYFYPEHNTLLDYFDNKCTVVLDDPSRIGERAETFINEFHEEFKQMLTSYEVLPHQSNLVIDYDELITNVKTFKNIIFEVFEKANVFNNNLERISVSARELPDYKGRIDHLVKDIKQWKKEGLYLLIISSTANDTERLERLTKAFLEYDITTSVLKDATDFIKGELSITQGVLSRGFELKGAGVVILTDKELFGVSKKSPSSFKKKKKITEFVDLKVGGYVVHETHGVGKYVGLQTMEIEGVKKDYLHVKYAGTDSLYVPSDQINLIQPYIGIQDKAPKLSKLGGTEWQKTKNKVRQALKELAFDLVELYAYREKAKGFKYSKDLEWQKQFEDKFPYEETPDQLSALKDIKSDMESDSVMDRLLCGDVGYGKTEVAIRAAFKAVLDGKQVAVLAPTTILAQQHYNTLAERCNGFPVVVDVISRFKTVAEQKRVIQRLRTGNIDIIVGTHRILGKDVKFKDLGLLIIDEEQRFGVSHKELIKNIKKNIDVLTLTATPIPRTLHMSLVGIRDISTIETPPEERFPVQTYVVEYNDNLIRDSIYREVSRGGQVYFVYNKVKSMDFMLASLKKLMPDIRIAVAHGQMNEKRLEKVMMDFYNHVYDVLLCSVIIENGLDIPNVNTIIVHDSDKFGLSQLHQLRGRVGRANKIAYAYFTYSRDKILSEVAQKRLKAIKEFTEFGAGFKIALRDLEIRGAGNILGPQQHGHMASIGYDLYSKMLKETIMEFKGEESEELVDTVIRLDLSAHIEEGYVIDESERILLYKRISSIESIEEKRDIEDELVDRFGDMPQAVQNLIDISYIKLIASRLKIEEISQGKNRISIKFTDKTPMPPDKIIEIANRFKNRMIINKAKTEELVLKTNYKKSVDVLKDTDSILLQINNIISN